MEDTYRYVIHAYEDVRQKRPIKHEHGGPRSSPTALRRSGGPNCSPKSSPMDGSTSTLSTERRRSKTRLQRAERFVYWLLLSSIRPSSWRARAQKPRPWAAPTSPCALRTDNAPEVRFSATLGEEPETSRSPQGTVSL